MTYTVKLVEIMGDTINTDVEYTFDDGSVQLIRVSHFQPENACDVIENIENRGQSEADKLEVAQRNQIIKQQLDILTVQGE